MASLGTPDAKTPGENLRASEQKMKLAAEKGAAALIEIFTLPMPWQTVLRYFGSDRLNLAGETTHSSIPHVWISGQAKKSLPNDLRSITMRFAGQTRKPVRSYNVAGIIEGADPQLKNEYVILSAHYDHVGTGKNGGNTFSASDSIFNGTRDNAFGTVAVLMAAQALSEQKPKRSVLLLGFTAEEIGLLGSRYYADHPLVPFKQCVYNLNCDGAGYSDTTLVTMIGLNRTDAKTEIEQGCQAFGLTVNDDPAPEQNLFDRSDNVSFAAKGIPAPTYSLGFRKFDAEIMKFYHQATDNPETISFGYLLKYCQAYVHTARLIADRATAPKWAPGDKYEKAYAELYGK
ncbi:MAG: M20/M25/M40 family metallo-hydrolase [Spirosomataceae bacterium]